MLGCMEEYGELHGELHETMGGEHGVSVMLLELSGCLIAVGRVPGGGCK